ncbi:allantoate permease [Grosmannia clavigera kw1407]|uniref:Allantoate permease n=1 Tax=Grosmannia clavigera (strain kw1407 / UAMH 11150) TaxID=655863 RepID=F0XBC1_GROCL|nr:allantoate permease [Grosmannia clavigera kw1407]EFX04995.1 allantoate permease [Grosmannia clavigera kw1407]
MGRRYKGLDYRRLASSPPPDSDAAPSSASSASSTAAMAQPEEQRADEVLVMDEATAKQVVRRIDWVLIPLLFTTYMLSFMDKTILSSASVFGLREDNHLTTEQYSWVSSIFYFGYLGWQYPNALLVPRLPVGRYLAVVTLVWGVVVSLTAACSSYGGLLAVRFLLGVAEASITPAFMFLTTTWYTRDEMPTRTGIWFAGNSVGGMVASLLAFGVGHISEDNVVGPWRSTYLILGLATFVWAFVLGGLLPAFGNIATAPRWLLRTLAERQFAAARVVVAGTGNTAQTRWQRAQLVECLVDPKTWLLFALQLLTQIPNGGTQNFANLVIKSFGFTSLQSTLINIPYSLLSAAAISGSGWLAGRYRQVNCLLIIAVVLPCIVGSALIYTRNHHHNKGAQLFGYFLLCTGSSAMPLGLSLVQANTRGVTKKMTTTALLMLAYCAGNIAGPHFFKAAEKPTYNTAFRAILVCYCLAMLTAVCLRGYLQWENARRTRREGFVGSSGTAGIVGVGGKTIDVDGVNKNATAAVSGVELQSADYEDVTDWEIAGFRYRLLCLFPQSSGHFNPALIRLLSSCSQLSTLAFTYNTTSGLASSTITMRAARYYGKEDIRIEQVPEPSIRPGQIKIAPAFVGICGTDLHEFLGGPNFCPEKPHGVTGETIPVTLGHEFSGVITEIGPNIDPASIGDRHFEVGQRVAVQPTIFCGHCAACATGAANVCHDGGFVGLSGGGGGLSEAVCVSATHVFPLPDNLSLEEGALVEPLSVSWHAVSAAPEIGPESVVLVLGGGPIGLAAVLCLKAKGVKTIVVSEIAATRQAFAAQFGADRIVNPIEEDVVQVVLALSEGRGADAVFDCAGVPASIKSACEAVKTKGTVVNVAIWEKPILFNPNWITFKESSYKSVLGYQPEDFRAVIENLRTGSIKARGMITGKIRLENLVQEGIKRLIEDKDNQVKILVDVNAVAS